MSCLVYFDVFSIFLVARHLESPTREESSHELDNSCINSPRTWESIVTRISVCREIAFLSQKAPNCAGGCTLLINSRIPSHPLLTPVATIRVIESLAAERI